MDKRNPNHLTFGSDLTRIPDHISFSSSTNDEKVEQEKRVFEQKYREDEQKLKHRGVTYRFVLFIVFGWLYFVMAIILCVGFGWMKNLSDPVLIALLTTTTANIIAMLWAIIKYLFPDQHKP
jgi:hypothetical protein